MPLFEFNCQKCGHSFEELLSLSEVDGGDLKCPACSSKRVVRGYSAFATVSASMSTGSGGSFGSGGGCGSGGFT